MISRLMIGSLAFFFAGCFSPLFEIQESQSSFIEESKQSELNKVHAEDHWYNDPRYHRKDDGRILLTNFPIKSSLYAQNRNLLAAHLRSQFPNDEGIKYFFGSTANQLRVSVRITTKSHALEIAQKTIPILMDVVEKSDHDVVLFNIYDEIEQGQIPNILNSNLLFEIQISKK